MRNATTTSADGAPETLAAALMEVAPLVMREIRRLMRSHRGAELSVPQFRALGYVRRHPACSLTEVADHLGLSVPATSRLIEALVAAGYIMREVSATDRRYIALRLSEQGERIQAEARAAALHSLTSLLEPLDATERERIMHALEPLRQVFSARAATTATTAESNGVVSPPASEPEQCGQGGTGGSGGSGGSDERSQPPPTAST
ncbi:MAG TPA: MarR family winged helix-turn-helix transcriptional regulator [Ktedonobacterales bacterium]